VIYSRNSKQYDPLPFVAPSGERFSVTSAPEGSQEAPRTVFVPAHIALDTNPILAGVRVVSRNQRDSTLAVAKNWLELLENISSELLIAITPNLNFKKITEAKVVLQRLVNVLSRPEGEASHGKILG